MNLNRLVDEVADNADSFLSDVVGRKETRDAVADHVQENYPDLSRKEQTVVINGVLEILEGEDFFGSDYDDVPQRRGHGNVDDD
ncbi:hypothetical protein [Actomonas aquatica]|uniref:Uncharacterized protein n=1 Tax=Actomonas aquatica TaxID=2866162 RepID=A0ABZ1C952_9BACT|nr:hypothetical protein [Opitutus sp. WL0086]WRQ88165.1 hypothetical protein K1X11_002015 [Opitutus sp. WL0086]